MAKGQQHPLPFNPHSLPRETKRHYISASDEDIEAMMQAVGVERFSDLYSHIPVENRFDEHPDLPAELSYEALQERLLDLASKNNILDSYLGDGLPHYTVMPVADPVCNIRNLTTAYTPYQPERSQGTLMTHWIYQCLMSQITGFEAINSSLYDRSTAIFEAICACVRLQRKADTVIVSEGIYPGDREVVETLLPGTGINIEWLPLDAGTGTTDIETAREMVDRTGSSLAGIVFPQVNSMGLLEDVDSLANLTNGLKATSIAVIDPALIGQGGLKPPTEFGESGVDMIVGEAQHLAIAPNFGGPGLGLFGVRYNESSKAAIRQTPGRYVGRARDISGRDCRVMVLSTREQHIRKDKATSNICSNQAYLATIAGAAILSRGESGFSDAFAIGHNQAVEAMRRLTAIKGIQLAFGGSVFINELTIEVPSDVEALIQRGRQAGLHIGVDVSSRIAGKRNLLKISFTDRKMDLDKLEAFFTAAISAESTAPDTVVGIPQASLRKDKIGIPQISDEEIISYYNKLGELNVSPDDACYPLGSCTMKYNPYINDWAASLPGFANVHPQAPVEDIQGNLSLLYEIQEWFKKITGLPGVTTQPVAGAQGELVGIKLFQAYHADRHEQDRDIILIPASAHGTNFATAVMAGYPSKTINGIRSGIILLDGASDGSIDMQDLEQKVSQYGKRIAGIMVTNPNTCGVFESNFRKIADMIHEVGGLVYMDGANMNAIAGWCDLGRMGVDAVHNNLHKTWTIPHGGGGPGDAIVAVSERLLPYLPGLQVIKQEGRFVPVKADKSIGSFHRHWGNFAHKVRAYAYLLRLGKEGVPRMTAMAVLSARYCFERLKTAYPTLPSGSDETPRMHEFILTLGDEDFEAIEKSGTPKTLAITRVGKLFLDFGFHAPTVAWPETFGLMIEPTESYSKSELDHFCDAVLAIRNLVRDHPEILRNVPIFTPVDRVDEVDANRNLCLSEAIQELPEVPANRLDPKEILRLPIEEISRKILSQAC